MFAIRAGRGYTINEDFLKATRKLMETKVNLVFLFSFWRASRAVASQKLETPASYKKVT